MSPFKERLETLLAYRSAGHTLMSLGCILKSSFSVISTELTCHYPYQVLVLPFCPEREVGEFQASQIGLQN